VHDVGGEAKLQLQIGIVALHKHKLILILHTLHQYKLKIIAQQ
jgi:hypothetical protein